MKKTYFTQEDCIGNTPLVRLQRLNSGTNTVLLKLEGDNPAGSVKDRPAMSMINGAEQRGEIKPGDQLVEATSGNTGIALAMAAAVKGYPIILIMPENMSAERRATMKAYGADIILVTEEEGMEGARDLALKMQAEGKGRVLDQFANPDNPLAHYTTTGPEIWRDTQGEVTKFISAMGTTGTIVGAGKFLKEQNPEIEIIGVEPSDGSKIPGIRRWPKEYVPKIYDSSHIDRLIEVSRSDAEATMHKLAKREGIFCGISSGGNAHIALEIAAQSDNEVIVTIVCDRGDRYISTGIFPE